MIAVALAVIAGVVAVTCGIVADSNHADSLAFLGVMVKTTAAQIFLTGALCTWALFAALWLLSVGLRRSRQRTLELRAIRTGAHFAYSDPDDDVALTAPGLPFADPAAITEAGYYATQGSYYFEPPESDHRAAPDPLRGSAPGSRRRGPRRAAPAMPANQAAPSSAAAAAAAAAASVPPLMPAPPTFHAVPSFPGSTPPTPAPPPLPAAPAGPAAPPATTLPPLPGDEPTLTEDGFAGDGPNPTHWPHRGH